MKTKVAALSFLLFILLIIAAADAGHLPVSIQAVYAFPNGDRLAHIGLYGMLALLSARAFPRPFQFGKFSAPLTLMALLVFSAAEEWSQALFATRTADPVDLACSCVGVIFGTWAARRWKRAPKNA